MNEGGGGREGGRGTSLPDEYLRLEKKTKGGGGRGWSRGTHVFPHPPNNALSNPQCDGCIEQF